MDDLAREQDNQLKKNSGRLELLSRKQEESSSDRKRGPLLLAKTSVGTVFSPLREDKVWITGNPEGTQLLHVGRLFARDT